MGTCLVFFYANNVIVGERDSEWLQNVLNIIIRLFWRYKIVENVAKSWMMICQPGLIWSGMLEDAVGRRCPGFEASYSEILRKRISYPECGI